MSPFGLMSTTLFVEAVPYDFGHRPGIPPPAENYCLWAMPNLTASPTMTTDSLDPEAGAKRWSAVERTLFQVGRRWDALSRLDGRNRNARNQM